MGKKATPSYRKGPELNEVNLVIEGGVGTGRIMRYISRGLFPRAIWVGTELSPILTAGKRRLKGEIDDETKKILTTDASQNPNVLEEVLHANCFDANLVYNICQKTGRRKPFLTSFNALFSLLDKNMNLWERKRKEDRILPPEIFRNSPYIGHLHVSTIPICGNGQTLVERCFLDLERTAREAGWKTDKTEFALLLIRPSQR